MSHVSVILSIVMALSLANVDSGRPAVKLSDEEEVALKTVLKGTNKFAIDLYGVCTKVKSCNIG